MLVILPSAIVLMIVTVFCLPAGVLSSSVQVLKRQAQRHTDDGVYIPLLRTPTSKKRRRDGQTGSIGLGDFQDVTYSVLIKIGEIETPVVVDTGSSDLWVVSDACTGNCSASAPLYPQATFQTTGLEVRLLYGDSSTGTHAYGPIGKDTVGLAGLTLPDQYFAAINSTNTSVLETGSAGIFGLGFPVNSVIWQEVFQKSTGSPGSKRFVHSPSIVPRHSLWQSIRNFSVRWSPENNFLRTTLHSLSSFLAPSKSSHSPRQSVSIIPELLASYSSLGPFLSRLVAQGSLAAPMFTITLQRDSVDVGGNIGMLAIGELPEGVNNASLTWAQVRGYPPSAGGLTPPADSPDEVYPLTWEIPLDDVYFDGNKLPRSTLSPSNISLTALVDTGSSLIRGPSDIIQSITNSLGSGGNFPCADSHSLAFQIGGILFPIDPRDFVTQAFQDSVDQCTANLASTDPPQWGGGGFLYSWSLGDPFLKSVLTAFYYGNLSYPSHDPPRIGFLSTVPTTAASDLQSAVAAASADGGNFPLTSDPAPSGTFSAARTNSNGVPKASTTSRNSNGSPQTGHLLDRRVVVALSIGVVLSRELW